MIPRRRDDAQDGADSAASRLLEEARSGLRLASGGLLAYGVVDNRSGDTALFGALIPEELASLERLVAAMPEIFRAGIAMELAGEDESEPPLELCEILLVGDERIASALAQPRGRFGLAAILAPNANVALELNDLRSALRSLERL